MLRVGLISDTHSLLRPEAKAFLQGCDHIIHGGDVGDADILEQLEKLAPVTAVRGNNDYGDWAESLNETRRIELGRFAIYAIHDLADLDIDARAAGVRVVISGHSHKPVVTERNGVLYVNPGSAGPRRFKLPVAAGELSIEHDRITVRIVELPSGNALLSGGVSR